MLRLSSGRDAACNSSGQRVGCRRLHQLPTSSATKECLMLYLATRGLCILALDCARRCHAATWFQRAGGYTDCGPEGMKKQLIGSDDFLPASALPPGTRLSAVLARLAHHPSGHL